MIEHTQGGTVLTGEAIPFFRMAAQLAALRFKVKTGMNMGRGSIVSMVKAEYGLKGSAARVLEQFEPIVEAVRLKQVHVDKRGA